MFRFARSGSSVRRRQQRGFMQLLWQLVCAVIALALLGRFAWWVAAEEHFGQVAAILWAIAFGAAYYFTLGNVFVRGMAAGFWAFLLVSLVSLPLSWMAESVVLLLALLVAQLMFAFHAGRALSARGQVDAAGGPGEPAGDVVANVGRWVLLSFGALIVLLLGPLFVLLFAGLVVDFSQQAMRWLAAAWGIAAVAWFGWRVGAVSWRGVPVCAWIYLVVTAAILVADALAGPFAAGTGVQVAYIVMPGALIAAFVEVFALRGSAALGGRRDN